MEEKELMEMTRLGSDWVVWEHWQNVGSRTLKGQSEHDYRSDLKAICEFDNLVSFWQIWNGLPHSDPANLFTYYDESAQKFFQSQYAFRGTSPP